MAVSIALYDWPAGLVPRAQLFVAGGQARAGGLTLGGLNVTTPEPGGRASLKMDFNFLKTDEDRRLAGWVMSVSRPGAAFRVPIRVSPQLVSLDDLGLTPTESQLLTGIPWSNGNYWSNGYGWAYTPMGLAGAAALAGSETLIVDITPYVSVLKHGHVIGHFGRAYQIMDISYSGTALATLTLSPPLRVAVSAGDEITFRPSMIVTAPDPSSFDSLYDSGGHLQPGNLTLIEALI